jgi:hypothetical protein
VRLFSRRDGRRVSGYRNTGHLNEHLGEQKGLDRSRSAVVYIVLEVEAFSECGSSKESIASLYGITQFFILESIDLRVVVRD